MNNNTDEIISEIISKNIKLLRKKGCLSIKQMSFLFSVTTNEYIGFENGSYDIPLCYLERLSNLFKIDLCDFFICDDCSFLNKIDDMSHIPKILFNFGYDTVDQWIRFMELVKSYEKIDFLLNK